MIAKRHAICLLGAYYKDTQFNMALHPYYQVICLVYSVNIKIELNYKLRKQDSSVCVCVCVVVYVDLLDESTDNTKKYTTTLSDAHNNNGLKSGTVKTTQAKLQASAAV